MCIHIKLNELIESLESAPQESCIYFERQGGRSVRLDGALIHGVEAGNEEALKNMLDS
jgi:hypothetical protein